MKKKVIIWIIGITTILLFTVLTSAKNSFNIGDIEKNLYNEYKTAYVNSNNGAIISNAQTVSWCPNSGIGCDKDITSEAIARLTRYAVLSGYKADADLEINFYYNHMRNVNTDFMMWKINNPSLTPASVNSAVDAELIMIEATLDADKLWDKDDKGRPYLDTANLLMSSLKEGLINNTYIPYCMYPQGATPKPCENKIFLGYINLATLKRMCNIDVFWCNVYTEQKNVMISAVQNGGIYTAYNVNTKQYTYENAPVHMNWVMKQLINDGNIDVVKPMYDKSRAIFMNSTQLCQEFQPGIGCKQTTPATYVYADYLEMASYMNDKEFALKLVDFIYGNRMVYNKPQDQYSYVSVFESLGFARREFKNIE